MYKITYLKLISIFCFLLFTLALIAAHNSPATKYEASIYSLTPLFFWIAMVILMTFGFSIIVFSLNNDELKNRNMHHLGMLIIFLVYTAVLSLFLIRNYYFWNGSGDSASHFGWVKEILVSGHIPNELFYPISHIYVAEISYLLGLKLVTLFKLIPLFFGLLYVPSMYLFAKSILTDQNQILLATVASCTFVHGWYLMFTPNLLLTLIFPILLYILVKSFVSNIISWKIIVLIMLFLIPPFHPVPSLALIIILLTIPLSEQVYCLIIGNKNLKSNNLSRFKSILIILLVVWGISWISNFGVWDSTIANYYKLIAEGGPSHVTELANQISYAQGCGYNVYTQILKVMGGTILYSLLTLLSLPLILKVSKSCTKTPTICFLYGPFFSLSIIIFVLYISNIGFGPLRMIVYLNIISTIFVGYIIAEMIRVSNKYHSRFNYKLLCCILILFFMCIFLSGMLKLFPSPYLLGESYHTTQTETEGMKWLFNKRDIGIEISGISIAPGRFASFLLTPDERKEQSVKHYLTKKTMAPLHFGYDINDNLYEWYNETTYLAIIDKDKSLYVDVYPDLASIRWSLNDYEKLNDDSTIDKIYSNDGFNLWYINNC